MCIRDRCSESVFAARSYDKSGEKIRLVELLTVNLQLLEDHLIVETVSLKRFLKFFVVLVSKGVDFLVVCFSPVHKKLWDYITSKPSQLCFFFLSDNVIKWFEGLDFACRRMDDFWNIWSHIYQFAVQVQSKWTVGATDSTIRCRSCKEHLIRTYESWGTLPFPCHLKAFNGCVQAYKLNPIPPNQV